MLGLDAIQPKVDQINAGESYIEDVPSERLAPLWRPGGSARTTSWDALRAVDAILICLPTPADRAPRAGPVGRAGRLPRAWPGACAPGTWWCSRAPPTRARRARRSRPCWSARACARAGTSTWPSRPSGSTPAAPTGRRRPPRRSSAGSRRSAPGARWSSTALACETLVPVGSPEVAELTKLLENIFRSVNIALVNELAMLCDRMGIDVWDVIEAAATKPFGFMPFRPGPGPRRPLHPDRPLLPHVEGARVRPPHRVHRAGRQGQLADAAVLRRQGRAALNSHRQALNGSRVLVSGVAYKADVNDTRESPALRIIELLRGEGAQVELPRPPRDRAAEAGLQQRGRSTPRPSTRVDVAVVVTAHSGIDWGHGGATTRRWSWTSGTSSRSRTARSGGSDDGGNGRIAPVHRRRRHELLGPQPGPQLRPARRAAASPGSATATTAVLDRHRAAYPQQPLHRPATRTSWRTPTWTRW